MALRAGMRLGPYEVQGAIGAGGMGEVYRARDTRLGRDVAVKVVPEHVAQSPEALARFEREARIAASLNDPHICAVHDVGVEADVHYAVLELLEGETLRECLSRGGLPPSKAVELATQICQGLAAAHARGIVHRDVKPENLFLTRAGLKILDFGLAKQHPTGGAAGDEGPSRESTLSTEQRLTTPGTAPGTVAYMSPEQVRGENADTRSDIFATGLVLFEMLSGRRPFRRDTQAETLVAILKEDPPDLTTSSGPVAPGLERIVRRCLEKDPEDRFQSARDVTFALEAVSGMSWDSDVGAEARRKARGGPGWKTPAVLVLASAALLAGIVGGRAWRPSPERVDGAPVVRSEIDLGVERALTGPWRHPVRTELALSPDGTLLAWSGWSGDRAEDAGIFVRRLGSEDVTRLPGTDGANQPFFSPDGGWLGFSVYEGSGKEALRKVPVEGGLVVDIAELSGRSTGASWASNGRIYLGAHDAGLRWVPAEGGALREVTAFEPTRESGHRLPHVLADGHLVLMTTMPRALGVSARVEAVSTDTGERRVVVDDAADARYLPTGHLVFVRQGVLMAAPFDLDRLELKATPVPVLKGVSQALRIPSNGGNSGAGQYAASESGLLVYGPGGIREPPRTELILMDESCGVERLPGFDRPQLFQGRLSPNGRLLAYTERSAGLWLFDVERHTHRALQREGHAGGAIWSPDGRRLAVHWTDAGPAQLWSAPVDGAGAWERLVVSETTDVASSWSPDGQFLAFIRLNPESTDILLYRFEDGEVVPFLTTDAHERYAEFSPDGRWMAYTSNESGQREVYVTSFPGRERVLTVSDQGGSAPAWSPDGKRLFYRSLDRFLMSVSVAGPRLVLGKPRRLCEAPWEGASPWRGYGLHPDGRRFSFSRVESEVAPPEPITRLRVVHNWFAELERLAPTER